MAPRPGSAWRPALVAAGACALLGLACGGVDDLVIVQPEAGPPPDPTFEGAPTCPGNAFFTGDATYGSAMFPGEPCLACHEAQGGVLFAMGGTVFATGKVLDDCLPLPDVDLTQAQVVIHDANGDHPLPVLDSGNFRTHAAVDDVAFPYTASVVYQGRKRSMTTAQTDGDCNGCHTASGKSGAPGRIALP